MKLTAPPLYVVFGPVGHPQADAIMFGLDKEELGRAAAYRLERRSCQGDRPSIFFDEDVSMLKQGYVLAEVINGEISDDVLRGVTTPVHFSPVKLGPGRKIESYRRMLPSFCDVGNAEMLSTGIPECDHDFGLETYGTTFFDSNGKQHACDGDEPDIGRYFNTIGCTRCSAVYAIPQK